MSLSGLLPLLHDLPSYRAIADRLAAGESAYVEPPLQAAHPYILASLHADVTNRQSRPMIVVAPRSERARQLYEGLLAYSPPGTPVYYFPAPDLLPYERVAPDPTITGERLTVLANLLIGVRRSPMFDARAIAPTPTSPVIVTSVFALMQPTMAPADMRHALRWLQPGDRVNLHELLEHLINLGYEQVAMVEEPGQFSRRGGIIDLFPPTSNLPVRVELFGDKVDSIRLFNPLTQRSEGQAESLVVTPATEIPLWRRAQAASLLRQLDTSGLREEVLEEWRTVLDRVESGERFEGIELFAPYYTQPLASLADYLLAFGFGPSYDGGTNTNVKPLLVLDDIELIRLESMEIERQADELYRTFLDNGELPPGMRRPYLMWDEVVAHGRGLPTLYIGGGAEGAMAPPPFAPSHLYAGNISALIADLKEMLARKARIIVVSQQSSRLRELLEDQEIYPTVRKGSMAVPTVSAAPTSAPPISQARPQLRSQPQPQAQSQPQARPVRVAGLETMGLSVSGTGGVADALGTPPPPASVNLLQGALLAGWQLVYDAVPDIVVFTDTEIFGRSQPARRLAGPVRRSTADAAAILREKMLLELKPGDYVVHIEHGIAIYGGLVKMSTGGVEREYMLLQYAEGDRLYVPADQTDRVAPYIGAGPPPTLHRLGTAEWARTKKRVKQAAEQLARELLDLYTTRELAPGHAYSPDTPWQYELEESFPYIETPDQLRAIAEVKSDMEQPRPMDRLICGDVGYGKTEVALRAAFKAVMDGKQVAVLVPTTVLAQQHYNTFSERLAAFPVTIEMLSRFRSPQEQQRITRALAEGRIDIVIGTHMLLSKNVRFKNLGLVVVDEEQRFGVRHKEHLKQLRTEVDVLTLSATPIPRTLYMAISGVRDLSLIETPPEARLPIKTYVTAYRPQLVREVILRELERGGQVFFVHNRVETIYRVLEELQALVPEARFLVAHGQMPEQQLERVMADFVAGRADVLVCTTIIESGLDIPNANTLIVDHADKLGLAQLYQLRGRVGRGASRAYSYFLYHPGRKVTENARERLSTIEQATELGAGFRIALKDLEIRGAGNLLGPEQSGHVAAVGLDLYTRLLSSAVEKARAERRAESTRTPTPVETAPGEGEEPTVSLDLPISAYLPEDYVPDPAVRLRLYQRMAASLTPAQVRDMAREMQDRFGPLPPPAANLLEVVHLKALALTAGVESIRSTEHEIAVQTREERAIPEPVRMRLQRKYRDFVRVTPHQVRINRAKAGDRWKQVLTGALEEMAEA